MKGRYDLEQSVICAYATELGETILRPWARQLLLWTHFVPVSAMMTRWLSKKSNITPITSIQASKTPTPN